MYKRPLSPHLQVYKLEWTSALSILHRLTGAGLFCILIFLSIWLFYGYQGDEAYESFLNICRYPGTKIALWVWGVSFIYHFLNGIRHLMWDMGKGFDLRIAQKSALCVGMFTFFLSILWGFWIWGEGNGFSV